MLNDVFKGFEWERVGRPSPEVRSTVVFEGSDDGGSDGKTIPGCSKHIV